MPVASFRQASAETVMTCPAISGVVLWVNAVKRSVASA